MLIYPLSLLASATNVVVARRPPLSISPRPRSLILTMDHRRSPYFLTHTPTASYESSGFYSNTVNGVKIVISLSNCVKLLKIAHKHFVN